MKYVARFRWPVLACLVAIGFLASSCGVVRRNFLLQSKDHRRYYRTLHASGLPVIRLKPDSVAVPYSYRIQTDDVLSLAYVNFPIEMAQYLGGFLLMGGPGVAAQQQTIGGINSGLLQGQGGALGQGGQPINAGLGVNVTISIMVDPEGNITLPMLGRVRALGYTPLQLRDTLEARYGRFFKDSVYLVIRVTSMRAFVISQTAQTVFLPDEKTHLTEILTLSGFDQRSRFKEVMIFRGNIQDPQLIWVDLTNFQSLKYPDLFIQPGDLIYIQPRMVPALTRDLSDYLSLLNSLNFLTFFLSTYVLYQNAFD